MGYFLSSLDNLEGALASGLPGDTAMSFLSQLQTDQSAKKDARHQSQALRQQMRQGNKMQQLLLATQAAGLPLGDILTEAGKAATVTGMPTTPQFLGGLVSGWQQDTGGQFDTSPLLDVDDRRAISKRVADMSQSGSPVNEIRNAIHTEFKSVDPANYDDLAESIDLIIQRALGG